MPVKKNQISPIELQIKIKRLMLTQRDLAKKFNVSDGAVSGAINNDPLLKSLRKKIINHLKEYSNVKKAS